ncbi:MAG: DUF5011 domain-containing protein [bacterium]|nr:DUF5011 domain-containing protein [bacterium]
MDLTDKEFDEDILITPFVLQVNEEASIQLTSVLPDGLSYNETDAEISGLPTRPGEYTISVRAIDKANNPTDATFKIRIKDKTAPEIDLNSPHSTLTLVKDVDSYTEAGATCSDNFDPTCSVEIGGDSVDTTALGEYIVSYTARDLAGNTSQKTLKVTVVS